MAGGSPAEMEDWTWGEVLLLAQSWRKARRQHYQALSVIAWQQAMLGARAAAGESVEPVYRVFPFWEEEEVQALRLETYRAMMERLAGKGEGKNE